MIGQKVSLLTEMESWYWEHHISSNSAYRHRVMLIFVHTSVQESFPVKKSAFCLFWPYFSSKHIQYKGVWTSSSTYVSNVSSKHPCLARLRNDYRELQKGEIFSFRVTWFWLGWIAYHAISRWYFVENDYLRKVLKSCSTITITGVQK